MTPSLCWCDAKIKMNFDDERNCDDTQWIYDDESMSIHWQLWFIRLSL